MFVLFSLSVKKVIFFFNENVENYEEMERGEGGGDVEPDYPNKVID